MAGIDVNGLGVLRALGSAGVPVVGIDTDLDKPEARTRYGRKMRVKALAGPEFVSDLLKLRSNFETSPVLILTQEASVATVSAARDMLSAAYRFTMARDKTISALMDKRAFQRLAERQGLPVPRALILSRAGTLGEVANLRYPCVVKPTLKLSGYGSRFAKAYKVWAPHEVERVYAELSDVARELIVQEWIEGSDSDVYFCLQYRPADGRRVASFVGRKICQWPLEVGGTASCVPAPEAHEALVALTDSFFSAQDFVGLCSMEYKRDRRDGIYYMIEPTVGRTDYQEEIATLNGVNIPLFAYCAELGLPVPNQSMTAPRRGWRDPMGYAKARRAGAPDPMQEIAPGTVISDAYWRLFDPLPYAALKMEAMRRRVSRLVPSLR